MEEILTEGGSNIQAVPYIGEGAVCLKRHCIAQVQEGVN